MSAVSPVQTPVSPTPQSLAGLPPGLAKRQTLPPGLANKKSLPPGLAKKQQAVQTQPAQQLVLVLPPPPAQQPLPGQLLVQQPLPAQQALSAQQMQQLLQQFASPEAIARNISGQSILAMRGVFFDQSA
jgi:hypothetical protein